jgi:hypothetical protein
MAALERIAGAETRTMVFEVERVGIVSQRLI